MFRANAYIILGLKTEEQTCIVVNVNQYIIIVSVLQLYQITDANTDLI